MDFRKAWNWQVTSNKRKEEMTILIVVIGIFGISFVGVLLDDMIFGDKRAKDRLEKMKLDVLRGRF